MKHLIGFILLWIALGMLLMLFIRNGILSLCLILFCLLLGYYLFSSSC